MFLTAQDRAIRPVLEPGAIVSDDDCERMACAPEGGKHAEPVPSAQKKRDVNGARIGFVLLLLSATTVIGVISAAVLARRAKPSRAGRHPFTTNPTEGDPVNAPERITTAAQPLTFIRASSLAELFDCPARWEAKHLLGMQGPRSGAAQLGTAVHAGTAAFDASRLPGGSPITADDAAGAVVDAIHKPEEAVDWEDGSPTEAERIALALHTKYCADVAPRQKYRGVEVTCEKLELPELGIALTGTTDRVRETPAGLGISDLKTGGRAVGTDGRAVTQGHAVQLGVYELLASHAMGLEITAPAQIVGMNTGKTAAAQRVGTGEVENARAALVGTEEAPGLLQHASRLIQSGAFYGNSKSFLCSAKYCPRHPVCTFKA